MFMTYKFLFKSFVFAALRGENFTGIHPVKNLNRACESCSFTEEDFGDGFKRPLGDIMDQLLVRTYNQPKARNVHNPHGGDKSMRSCIVCDCKGFQ